MAQIAELQALLARLAECTGIRTREAALASVSTPAKSEESVATASSTSTARSYDWARGTGYGHDGNSSGWDPASIVAAQAAKESAKLAVLQQVVTMLTPDSLVLATPSVAFDALERSALIPFLEQFLREDSAMVVDSGLELRSAVHRLMTILAGDATLARLLGQLQGQDTPLCALLAAQRASAEMFKSRLAALGGADGASDAAETSMADGVTALATTVEAALAKLAPAQSAVEVPVAAPAVSEDGAAATAGEEATVPSATASAACASAGYEAAMRPLLFGTHALQFGSEDASSGTLTRPAMVRIAKEMSAMMESLPCNPSSSIFLRCDEDRMHLIQAMVIGPEDTPYSGGCFLFNFTIPDSYPSSPPQVRLATTGGGSVSFNPNLYADGYVCLSLLGTWHGDSGEEWSPITSTLLQVLVSLQALVFVPEPYFNEPGYESSIGTPEGTESSKGFNAALVPNTIRLAMLEQMRNPPAGFEEVVRMHFALRRDAILTQARAWLEQAKAYGNEAALAPLVAELEAEMAKLPPAVAA